MSERIYVFSLYRKKKSCEKRRFRNFSLHFILQVSTYKFSLFSRRIRKSEITNTGEIILLRFDPSGLPYVR